MNKLNKKLGGGVNLIISSVLGLLAVSGVFIMQPITALAHYNGPRKPNSKKGELR